MAENRAKDKGKEKITDEIRKPDAEINETPKPDSERKATPSFEALLARYCTLRHCSEAEASETKELPPNATLLMNFEAADALRRARETLASLNVPKLRLSESLDSALRYLQDDVLYDDVPTVRICLKQLKRYYGATDWEICMIANVCPATAEKAYALIPSLKAKCDGNDEALNAYLTALELFRVMDFELPL